MAGAMDTARGVGIRIAVIRKRRGLKQEELAALIGRAANSVSEIERGRIAPGFDTLRRLGPALGVPVGDFFAPAGGEADGPKQAALLAGLVDGARTLPPADLEFAAGLFALVVQRYGR